MTYVLGKIAVITGAGSGIGRALALQLNREGCELYLSDINGESLGETLAVAVAQGCPCQRPGAGCG